MADLLRTLPNNCLAEEGRRRQRIGALQIEGVIGELEGGNPLPPQRSADDCRVSRKTSWRRQSSM